MDCTLSRLMLSFRRRELAAEDAAALDAHLGGCPGCAASARWNAAVDSAIGRVMTDVPVPAGLHDRLVRSARTRQGAMTRRTVTKWAVAVLTPLLAITTAVGLYQHFSRPTLSSDRVAAEIERAADFPDQALAGWLRGQGLPEALPEEFDPRHVVEFGRRPLLGREVPVVVFQNRRHGPDTCKVYIVRDGQFRLGELPDFTGSQVSVTHVRRDGLVYLIAYTGESLAPFFRRQQPE
jgi:Putative zinc-finger